MTANDLPAGLLRGAAGVYVVARPPGDLVRRLTHVDWTTGELTHGETLKEVLTGIGRALDFPAYYGANLDALWDCLTDLPRPTALVWRGWQDLAVHRSGDWARLLTVLGERVTQEPAFAVVLV